MSDYVMRTKIHTLNENGVEVSLIKVPNIVNATATITLYPDGTLRVFLARSEEKGGDIMIKCEANSFSVEEETIPKTGMEKEFYIMWPESLRGKILPY